jgi:flagellar basal-body rod protein FlgB
MAPIRLFDDLTAGLQRVLDLRRVQHTLTATNLANADTPGFRARELPFAELLGEALTTDRDASDLASSAVTERVPLAADADGNSVDAEREAVKLAENSLMFNAVAGGVSKRLALLRFAASDGRS